MVTVHLSLVHTERFRKCGKICEIKEKSRTLLWKFRRMTCICGRVTREDHQTPTEVTHQHSQVKLEISPKLWRSNTTSEFSDIHSKAEAMTMVLPLIRPPLDLLLRHDSIALDHLQQSFMSTSDVSLIQRASSDYWHRVHRRSSLPKTLLFLFSLCASLEASLFLYVTVNSQRLADLLSGHTTRAGKSGQNNPTCWIPLLCDVLQSRQWQSERENNYRTLWTRFHGSISLYLEN